MRLILLIVSLIITTFCWSQQKIDSADYYFSSAQRMIKEAKLDDAITYWNKALPLYEKAGRWKEAAGCLNKSAETCIKISAFDKAVESSERILAMDKAHPGLLGEEIGFAYLNLGKVFTYKTQYKRALDLLMKAVPILKKHYGDDHEVIGRMYLDIREVYSFEGQFELAKEYDQMALDLFNRAYGGKHPGMGRAYVSLGAYHMYRDEDSKALAYYELALKIYRETIGEETLEVADTYRNMGKLYTSMGNHQKVLETQKKGLAIYMKIVGERKPQIIIFYWNMGDAYSHLGEPGKAVQNYQKAISIIKGIFGEKHPGLVSSYYRLAEFYKEQGQYDIALENYQKSIIANIPTFNNPDIYAQPPLEDYFDQERLYNSIELKGIVFLMKYNKDKSLKALKTSLETFQLLDTLLDKMRQSYTSVKDKIDMGRKTAKSYEDAIQTCLRLYKETQEQKYQDIAFYFSEKNKAGALTDALYETSAKGVGLIPANLLELEKKIKDDQTQLRSTIAQAKMNKEAYDTAKISQLNRQLFEAMRREDSLKGRVENDFPKYYELKYHRDTRDVKNIQQRLPQSTALIEYFEGESTVQIFSITKNTFTITSIKRDSVYDKSFLSLRKNLEHATSMSPAKDYEEFISQARNVYRLLLEDVLKNQGNDQINKLIIIPDGQLLYLPFEVLLTREPSAGMGNYAGLDYVLKQYSVTYGYSASLIFKDHSTKRSSNAGYLSLAPVYSKATSDSLSIAKLGRFRSDVSELKWNQHEVQTLSAKIGGDYYLAEDATERSFKQKAGEYNVIHLAMHALVDDEDPMNSKLVFTQSKDSTEDGYLHAFELYNMKLDAQLVVLSACNTGYGKLTKGEGIMSLSRAFSYAGVPSVTMTQWRVDDETTSKLMEYFYENLAEGMMKGEALQKAKLSYLSSADPADTHPFFWAAFVSMGDDDPIVQKSYLWQILGALSALVIISVAIIYFKKR